MNKNLIKFKIVLFFTIILITTINLYAQEHHKGVFRIKFEPEAEAILGSMKIQKSTNGIVRCGIAPIDQLSEKYKATNMRRVFPYAGKYEAKHQKYGLHLWYEITVDETTDIRFASDEYNKLSQVSHAELVLKKSIGGTKYNSYNGILGSLPGGTNDPLYADQWHYNNTGQSGGTVGADIDLPEAWTIQTGTNDVIVSIHDGGVDFDHEDLAGNMWINSNEVAGNGVDDDNNGYIDDIYGYNFADATGTIAPGNHGTHVAGTVAAETNNGIGMSGVAGGTGIDDGVRLMSCQVFGNTGNAGFPASYIYAADNGAVISQNSWGYTFINYYEQAVLDAIDYFIAEAGRDENGNQIGPMAGGIVIFSAGNGGSDNHWYPGYYEPVMAIAGTDHNDNKYVNSNFGAWVELAAPAVNIYSTLPNDDYTGGYNGTSMACPHVSGTAALILSHFKDDGITPTQLWERIVNSTDSLTFEGAEGWGTGRLNAFKALNNNDGEPPITITDMVVDYVSPVSVRLTWTAPTDQPDGSHATHYELRWSTNPITAANFELATNYEIPAPGVPGSIESVVVSGLSFNTSYYFAVKSVDYFGNTSEISNIVTATTLGEDDFPVISINPFDTLKLELNSNESIVENSVVSNLGGSLLDYRANIVFLPDSSNEVGQVEFKDSIAYDPNEAPLSWQYGGWNGGAVFSCANRFIVTTDSFKLTHITNYYKNEGSADSVTLEVYRYGLPGSGILLTTQKFIHPEATVGTNCLIELDNPQYFVQGETFFVVIHYPATINQAAGYNYDDGDFTLYGISYLYDISLGYWEHHPFPGTIYKIRAFEEVGEEAENWLSIDPTEGELEPGEANNHAVTVNASSAKGGYQYAKVVYASNDPVSPTIEWLIQLYVDKPIEIISAPDTLYVNEGQSINMVVEASDPTGGQLEFTLANNYEFITLEVIDGTATVNYTPDFEQAGIHDFTLDVTNNAGDTVSVSWAVVVANVNRPPAAIADIDDKIYFIDDPIDIIDLNQYFVDPDGDAMNYSAYSVPDNVTAFSFMIQENNLEINPYSPGIGTVYVNAHDGISGTFAGVSFTVTIRNRENSAPVLINPIDDITMNNGESVILNLDDHFVDIDGDAIEYSFGLSGRPPVRVSLSGSELLIESGRSGMCILTIHADDGQGGITSVSVIITVTGGRNRTSYSSSGIDNKTHSITEIELKELSLSNFPNPFNDQTTIAYEFANDCKVRLEVLNSNGKTIDILANEDKPAGKYTIEYSVANLSSGIYFYRLTVNDDRTITKQMIIK